MANLGECSYSIIMATEIIGLSYEERQIVANVVKYNHLDFDYYETSGSIRPAEAFPGRAFTFA